MDRKWLIWAGFHGFLSVAMGAFAAHALKNQLDPDMLRVIETGARYEMYGALALLGLAQSGHKAPALCMAWGSLVFSGSLYALGLSGLRIFGALTPLGGLGLLAGWGLLAWEAKKA